MDHNSSEIRKLQHYLNNLAKRITNKKPLMVKIAGIMHTGVEKTFEEEGRPKWKQLAKSTIRDRTRKGYWPGKILQREGMLIRSIIPRATEDQSIVATNEPYAAILHFGGVINMAARSETFVRNRYKRKPKKGKFKKGSKRGRGFSFKAYRIVIPPRPYMLIREPEVDEIIEAIENHILD